MDVQQFREEQSASEQLRASSDRHELLPRCGVSLHIADGPGGWAPADLDVDLSADDLTAVHF